MAVAACGAWLVLVVAGPAIRRVGGLGDGWTTAAPVSGLFHASTEITLWLLMTVAMMLPSILPTARHVGLVSYWDRRQRAIAAYATGYLAAWTFAGVALIGAIHVLQPVIGAPVTAAAVFAAAIAWQWSPRKQQALASCSIARPVPSSARGGDLGCLGLGAEVGMSCIASCWALMGATLATSHSVVSMIVVSGVILGERRTDPPRPRRVIPVVAALGVATVLALVAGGRLP